MQLLASQKSSFSIFPILKGLNDFKAFIEYSNDLDDIYKNIEVYNPNEKHKILIAFDDMLLICFVIKNLIQ